MAEKRQFLRIAKNLCATFVALFAFVIAPAFADGESISSVTVVGATEQNGTPTPTNPVNIVVNNGVVKVSPNLAPLKTLGTNVSNIDVANGAFAVGIEASNMSAALSSTLQNLCPSAKPGDTLYVHYESQQSPNVYIGPYGSGIPWGNNTAVTVTETMLSTQVRIGGGDNSVSRTLNVTNFYIGKTPFSSFIPYGSIYTEGAGETIADSANHTATVETLFAVGDYVDEQNINTGTITRKVGIKVFDGTEEWIIHPSGAMGMSISHPQGDNNLFGYCSHFLGVQSSIPVENLQIGQFKMTSTSDSIYFKTEYDTVIAWKQYLAEQYNAGTPVIIVYPLATETTENVTAQTMTTAPVIQNNGTIATTIRTLLQNGQTLVSNSLELGIRIATTAYNAAAFAPVEAALETAVTTIKDVVANTIVQADAIQNLQDTKQTMPDANGTNGTCPQYRQCLLVESEDGTPQWFPIIDPFKDFITPILANNANITPVDAQRRFYGDDDLCRMLPQTDAESQANNGIAKCTGVAIYNDTAAANTVRGSALKQTEWGYEFKANNIGANPATDNPNNDEGIVYGISKCVSTAENNVLKGTYAKPATSTQLNNALWDARPTTMAEAGDYKNCWCKATGIAYGGQYYETSAAPWVFRTNVSAAGCASNCASYCADDVRANASFRNSIMGWAVE